MNCFTTKRSCGIIFFEKMNANGAFFRGDRIKWKGFPIVDDIFDTVYLSWLYVLFVSEERLDLYDGSDRFPFPCSSGY